MSNLKRKKQTMPKFVQKALHESQLGDDYLKRPAYQQNDYLWWINDAQKQETKEKRLRQMLDELKQGGVYMKMEHAPSQKK